jgi:hypothetical protein
MMVTLVLMTHAILSLGANTQTMIQILAMTDKAAQPTIIVRVVSAFQIQ